MTSDDLYQIVKNGKIAGVPNPIVTFESLPENPDVISTEKDSKNMNTRIVYINGRRIPQGNIAEFLKSGGMSEPSLVIAILASVVAGMKGEVKDLAVDEYISGRLINRFEWNASNPEVFGPIVTRKFKEKDALYFRLLPVTSDSYMRP